MQFNRHIAGRVHHQCVMKMLSFGTVGYIAQGNGDIVMLFIPEGFQKQGINADKSCIKLALNTLMMLICSMSKQSKNRLMLPAKVKEALGYVGRNIKLARVNRAFTQQHLADLIGVDRNTIRRIESGDPGVSFGLIAHTLWALQLDQDLQILAKPENDKLGLSLSRANMKIRVRTGKLDDEYDF